jgi:hypothetical protein
MQSANREGIQTSLSAREACLEALQKYRTDPHKPTLPDQLWRIIYSPAGIQHMDGIYREHPLWGLLQRMVENGIGVNGIVTYNGLKDMLQAESERHSVSEIQIGFGPGTSDFYFMVFDDYRPVFYYTETVQDMHKKLGETALFTNPQGEIHSWIPDSNITAESLDAIL